MSERGVVEAGGGVAGDRRARGVWGPFRGPQVNRLTRALPALGVAAIWLFLIVFLVYPLLRIFYDAVSDETGRFTLANVAEFATDAYYVRSLWNSIVLGVATVVCASILGFAIAFLLVRYDFAGRELFSYLTLIPIISPPLVGVLGFTFIMGRAGTVNVILLASQAYLNIVQFVDRRLFRMGIVISALMVMLAVLFLIAARRYVAIKDYSSLSYSRIARRRLSPAGQALVITFLSLVMLASFVPLINRTAGARMGGMFG